MALTTARQTPCPVCRQSNARRLEWTSQRSGVDTFQCLACKHIWTATAQTVSLHPPPQNPPPATDPGATKRPT
jgi:hypothetical protein